MASITIQNLLSECKVHGSGKAQVTLEDSEIYALFCIGLGDLGWDFNAIEVEGIEKPDDDYFKIPIKWFNELQLSHVTPKILLDVLERACAINEDFGLYIRNLCALHRRRVKYQRILSAQPLPQMDQIGPRSLLEYGECDDELLSGWMSWRKWIYDIDNRSAQETGYLFEPVLASCLGGTPVGARNSPVKRVDGNGNQTSKGRQVDCFVAGENLAYEFKMRVTIAASGQGRFGEELSFPFECQVARFKPILIVLDPTPSPRLNELRAAFENAAGSSYIGEEAWRHINEKSGEILSIFVEKYIRPPIESIEGIHQNIPPDLYLQWRDSAVLIKSPSSEYLIERSANADPELQ